jgi:1-deoxy-D-xylulose 5-phosphate reductoisomerase
LVSRFLSGDDVSFGDIAKGVFYAMSHHQSIAHPSCEDIFNAIAWTQEFIMQAY